MTILGGRGYKIDLESFSPTLVGILTSVFRVSRVPNLVANCAIDVNISDSTSSSTTRKEIFLFRNPVQFLGLQRLELVK